MDTYRFAKTPNKDDFEALATHLRGSDENRMHPSVWRKKEEVSTTLDHMALTPDITDHQSAYHSFRLLVW